MSCRLQLPKALVTNLGSNQFDVHFRVTYRRSASQQQVCRCVSVSSVRSEVLKFNSAESSWVVPELSFRDDADHSHKNCCNISTKEISETTHHLSNLSMNFKKQHAIR